MLNHITIMGRLTRDPELRRIGSGVPVTSFTLAVDRDIPNKESGEKETDFIDCNAWRCTAEFVAKHFSKGRMAIVSGRLQIRNWVDKDSNKRRSAEVVADSVYFGDSKKSDTGDSTYSAPYSAQGGSGDLAETIAYMGKIQSQGIPAASEFTMLGDDDPQLPF